MLRFENVAPVVAGRRLFPPVTFDLHASEVVALVGANGVGKTSLLRAALGLLPCDGDVLLDDRPIAATPRRELAKRIAYVPQRATAGEAEAMTVRETLALGRVPHLPPFGGESAADRRAVAEVAARLDVADLLERPMHTLSGGQAQRAHVGRALTQRAAVVLLDEPDAFLDLARQAELADLLRLLAGDGLALLIASHDLNLAAAVADRVVLLSVEPRVGPPREVLTAGHLRAAFGPRVHVRDDPFAVLADLSE